MTFGSGRALPFHERRCKGSAFWGSVQEKAEKRWFFAPPFSRFSSSVMIIPTVRHTKYRPLPPLTECPHGSSPLGNSSWLSVRSAGSPGHSPGTPRHRCNRCRCRDSVRRPVAGCSGGASSACRPGRIWSGGRWSSTYASWVGIFCPSSSRRS